MHFDLLQSLSIAGDAAIANDDRAGLARNRAWVIDGATDLGPAGLVGAQGGAAWLADRAQAALAVLPDAPIPQLFEALAARLIEDFEAARTREPEAAWERPVAAGLVVRLEGDAIETGWLGDCVALLWRDGSVARMGPKREMRSQEADMAARHASEGLGSVKRAAAPILADLRAQRGRPGIRVLTVVPEPMAEIDSDRIRCAPGDELLLMTDGYAALIDSYDAFDESALFSAVRAEGLSALGARLRAIEDEDAACTRYPRFKKSDDATALWLRVGG